MPTEKEVYDQHADSYEQLISREDFEGNILKTIQEITSLNGLDVIDLGAGTGRLACLLAPHVNSMRAYDASAHMLEITSQRLKKMGLANWETAVADHRATPAETASADLVVSGWSFAYLWVWGNLEALEAGWGELARILRPNGLIILLETLGTGNKSPIQVEHLKEYYAWLEQKGFQQKAIRTDYQFKDEEEAQRLIKFFFGEEMISKLEDTRMPECTGVWWRRI